MITSIKADNVSDYKALFEEASDILSGYKRVRTYDAKVPTYYYKNVKAIDFVDLYKELVDESGNSLITNLTTFASNLEKYSILYIREGGVADGYEPMLGITTLEEYFSWLKTLSGIDIKYTVLPLDEDYFEINANTRAITIPANFKKNGIAVQGDDLAEVLYFKIDRYFDYMDLNNTEIYIQWETPKDSTGQVKKSVSQAYIRDIESEPGKLIFGWAISDIITELSGTLKFSVRFLQWEDEENGKNGTNRKLDYSFNTLTASVMIQPGINFDMENGEFEPDDPVLRLLERIKDSEVVGGYAAAVPIFEKDLDVPNADLIYDLDPETGVYELLAQAYSTDTGSITYTWKKQGLDVNNSNKGQDIVSIEGTNIFVEVEDLNNLSKSYNYYYRNGSDSEGNDIYVLYTGPIPPSNTDLANSDFKLFIKQSKVIVDSAGTYWVVAENRITNSSSSEESKKADFLRPEPVVITTPPVEKGILVDVSTEEGVVDYQCPLTVTVGNTDGTVLYQWERDLNATLNFGDKAPNFEEIPDATEATYIASEPGHYRVSIINTRNKEENGLEEVDRPISRVTYHAQIPSLIDEGVNTKIFQVESLTASNCPSVSLDPNIISDGYSIAWYLNENNQGVLITESILAPGITRMAFNPKDYEEKIVDISADKDIDGSYYAIITNYVNGSSASTSKPSFEDMFKITY